MSCAIARFPTATRSISSMVVSQLAPETTRDELAEYFAAHHAKASRQTQRERQQPTPSERESAVRTLQDTWRVVLASDTYLPPWRLCCRAPRDTYLPERGVTH